MALALLLGGNRSAQASAWTEGAKSVLFIRVDFSDLVGDPVSVATVQSLINTTVNNSYIETSYNKTSLAVTVVPTTLRMPQTAAWYSATDSFGNNQVAQLLADARAAALSAGYDTANYDRDIVGFANIPAFGFGGLAYVGAKGMWMNGEFDFRVAAHELGHNYGLYHGNLWQTTDSSIIGAGASTEYGDDFDTMGSNFANTTNTQFNAWFKNRLDWLLAPSIQNVTTSGTYRIQALDNVNSSGLRALELTKDANTNYWVEFRQKFTGNAWAMSGALVHWGYNTATVSNLLDMTPTSSNGDSDAPLTIGQTFADTAAGLYITPIGKGGTSPETLDVVVNKGTFPGNHAPTITINAGATSVSQGTPVNFTANGSDADGDTLAYSWDFGDSTFNWGTNVTKTWNTGGTLTVRCTVSDMKGGTGTASVTVNVTNNDNFVNAQVISGNSGALTGSNVNYTMETNEPNIASYYTYDSAWYSWTPTNSGAASVDVTANNNFPLLAVYKGGGSSWNNLSLVGSNYNYAYLEAKVSFAATAGTKYYIQVAADRTSAGTLNLSWTLAPTFFLTGFNPASGSAGTSVTLTGNGFTGVTAVKFNGTSATYTVNSGTQITATVPANATTGTISVTGSGGTVTSASSFTVIPSLAINSVSVTEGNTGTTNANFAVSLTPASTQTVTVDYSTTGGTATADVDYVTTTGTLTIPAGATSGTISVPVKGDFIHEANETFFVNLVNPTNASIASGSSQGTGTILDDDTAGFTVTPTTGLTTTEAGGTATFIVALTSQPTADVTLGLSSSNTAEGTVAPTALTFTAANWNAPQTVTVTGVDDNVVDGNQAYTIITAPATSADTNYNGLDAPNVSVTNQDNDTAGITVTPTSGLTTTEAGGTATFTVKLTSQPTANVNIGLSSSKPSEGTIAPAALTFTTANWNVAQTVTITGVDDSIADGDQAYTISTAPATSSDTHYNGLDAADVSVTNLDNDTATLSLSLNPATFSEAAGANASIATLTRNTPTTSALVVSLMSSNTNKATVPVSATIPAGAASMTFAVAAVDNSIQDGQQTVTLTASAPGLVAGQVIATVTDNDAAGIAVTPTSGLTTTEAGGTATFTLKLNSQPTSDVSIDLSSSNTAEGTVTPATLTFTSANWNTPQTATITGVDDNIVDGNQAYTISTAPARSADANYSNLNAADVAVVNLDNDTAGFTVTPTTGLTTTEAGGTATFIVALTSQPTADVTLGLSSSNTAEGTVAPTALTFTAANWNLPQPITVTGVDDNVVDGDVAYAIVTAPATSADTNYNGLDAPNVSVTNQDNDVATLSLNITPNTFSEGAGANAATATLTRNTPTGVPLVVSLSSSDTGVATVPASVTIAPGNTAVTFPVAAVDNTLVDGTRTATITASKSGFSAGTAGVTVNDNDVPTLGLSVSATSFSEAGGATAATATVTRNTDTSGPLTINLSSSNTNKVTVPTQVTILAGALTATFPLTAVDNALTDGDQTATITATAPQFVTANQLVTITDNDIPSITVTPTSGLITTEAGGTATFTVVLTSQPTADVTLALQSNKITEGTVAPTALTFTAANWNLPQTVTVTGVDDNVLDGNQSYKIVSMPATSNDPNYQGLDAADVSVINQDNEVAPTPTPAPTATPAPTPTIAPTATPVPTPVPTATPVPMETPVPTATPAPALTPTPEPTPVPGATSLPAATPTLPPATLALTLAITPNRFSETASLNGGAAAHGTITLSAPAATPVQVSLGSNNLTKVKLPRTLITIPANSTVATFALVAVDDLNALGPQTVLVTAHANAYGSASMPVTVTDDDVPTLTLTVAKNHISEGAGKNATLATVRRNTALGSPLTITLASSAKTAATVPATVTLRAGVGKMSFPVAAVDDKLVDGPQRVTLTARAPGFVAGTVALTVIDNESASNKFISGHVITPGTTATGGAQGIGLTTLTLRRGATILDVVTADAAGAYRFNNLPAGRYTVAATKPNYTFTPASHAVTLGIAPTNINFTGTSRNSLSGRLSTPLDDGTVAGLTRASVVARKGATSVTARTDSTGLFKFDRLPMGTYTITPEVTGTDFTPRWRKVALTPTLPVAIGADFVATSSDNLSPTVTIATPRTGNFANNAQPQQALGRAQDSGGAGLTYVTVAIARFASAKATVPNGYWNWQSKTFVASNNPAIVENLALGTASWSLKGLPTLPAGFYGLRATATDGAANMGQSLWTRWQILPASHTGETVLAPTPAPLPSKVALSVGAAQIANQALQLHFTGDLDSQLASDPVHYRVTLNGHAVEVESAGYNAVTHSVTLSLHNVLEVGDSAVVQWVNLLDTQGKLVTGQSGVLVAK